MDVRADADTGWLGFFTSLPPQLQGVFVVVAALIVGWLGYTRFLKQFKGEAPQATEYAFGEPTTFADMGPVREIIKQIGALIELLGKVEAAHLRLSVAMERRGATDRKSSDSLDKLASLLSAFLQETRERQQAEEEREALERLRLAEEKGYREGFGARNNIEPRRSPSRKTKLE